MSFILVTAGLTIFADLLVLRFSIYTVKDPKKDP